MTHRAKFLCQFVAVVILLAAGGRPAAAQSIKPKLPYSISYDLKPIEIEITSNGPKYHIYDAVKEEVASGDISGSKTITFTPPRYGWYCVEADDGLAHFIGVTPKFAGLHVLAEGESHGGWNDEAYQAFAGFMLDRTNTRMGDPHLERVVDDAARYGVTLLVQFEGKGDCDPGKVEAVVSKFKGRVKYWEIMNEPNFAKGLGPAGYADLVKAIVPLIHRIDPEAKVMGPDCCGVQPWIGWIDGVYKAGGGNLLDCISVHDYEGDNNVEPWHWNKVYGAVRKVMTEHGDGTKEIWQTERAIGAITGGKKRLWDGAEQAFFITLQRDLLESYGIPTNHNNHYYVSTTGYEGVPTYVNSTSGPFPAALANRTRYGMMVGRKFVKKLDLGLTGNKVFLGLEWQGADGTTVMLRNYGAPAEIPLEVNVSGSGKLVDCWGNETALNSGTTRIMVPAMGVYLRLGAGGQVTVPPVDFGANLAPGATFAWSGGGKVDYATLSDGKFPRTMTGMTGLPFQSDGQALEISFGKKTVVGKVIIYAGWADNPHTALLDYDLEYDDGGTWKTIEKVRTPCGKTDTAKVNNGCNMVGWYQGTNMFVHEFKAVSTDKLRIVVHRITHGFLPDEEAVAGFGRDVSTKCVELREIEIYQ